MPLPWGFLKRVLAGAIFGLYMAHLLYFLNPQIDITPASCSPPMTAIRDVGQEKTNRGSNGRPDMPKLPAP